MLSIMPEIHNIIYGLYLQNKLNPKRYAHLLIVLQKLMCFQIERLNFLEKNNDDDCSLLRIYVPPTVGLEHLVHPFKIKIFLFIVKSESLVSIVDVDISAVYETSEISMHGLYFLPNDYIHMTRT